MEVGQAQEDLKHFFDNMRNKPSLFDDLVGYIWKLECGELGHDHFHVLLFFTNDRLKNDYHRAKQIGEYWVNVITKGRGRYFNCNDPEISAEFRSTRAASDWSNRTLRLQKTIKFAFCTCLFL